jgi:alcohol dehydrogenase
MKIRGAVLNALGAQPPYNQTKPLSVDAVELEAPGRGEVLVRIAAAGLCHSDLSVINGDRPRPTPMLLGHEAAGVIEACGEDVDDLEPDDHVVLIFIPSCGHCLPCSEGRPALCTNGAVSNTAGTLMGGHRRLFRGGERINHHMGCSAFADHAVVSRNSVVKVDRDIPLEEAALFGCAVLTGVGAVVNTARVPMGATVAIVGLGGVGLAALLGAVAAGASRIVAVDVAKEKLEFAKTLGATDTFDAAAADAVDAIRKATDGGVEYALEFAGSVKAMELAYKVTRRGGTTVTAGLPHPSQTFAIPHTHLVAEERTVKGSYIGTCVPQRDLPRFVALYKQGKLPVDKLLTHRMKLDEINEGFERLREGKAVRQVVVF